MKLFIWFFYIYIKHFILIYILARLTFIYVAGSWNEWECSFYCIVNEQFLR